MMTKFEKRLVANGIKLVSPPQLSHEDFLDFFDFDESDIGRRFTDCGKVYFVSGFNIKRGEPVIVAKLASTGKEVYFNRLAAPLIKLGSTLKPIN